MVESSPHEVTGLLKAWSAGDEGAGDRLARVVYRELHAMARRYMAGERSGHTLQTTALVNEVYLRLVNAREVDWQNRAHFFALCARSMWKIGVVLFCACRRVLPDGFVTPLGAPPYTRPPGPWWQMTPNNHTAAEENFLNLIGFLSGRLKCAGP